MQGAGAGPGPVQPQPGRITKTAAVGVADKAEADGALMSSFLRRITVRLALHDKPTSWRLKIWHIMCGGRIGSSLALVATIGSFLKGVLDSPDLNHTCMCFMDVATMLGTVFYQVTFANSRSNTRRMLERLEELCREVEADADAEQMADMHATVRSMRRIIGFLTSFMALLLPLILITPPLTGELTMSFYPKPEGIFWYLACFTQEFATLTCLLSVSTIMTTLMLISYSISSLARVLSLRLKESRGEESMRRLSRLHRDILDVSEAMPNTYYLTLFTLITGYLTVSLLRTYNAVAGSFDLYNALIVPGALGFYYNIATISDVLYTSTAGVCDATWGMNWTEEAVPVRRLVLLMMARAQRPASVRVPILGAVTLPVFMDSMRQWYSFLQMIRSLNDT